MWLYDTINSTDWSLPVQYFIAELSNHLPRTNEWIREHRRIKSISSRRVNWIYNRHDGLTLKPACVWLSICVSVCLSIYLCLYVYMCLSVYMSVYLCVCMSTCICVCLSCSLPPSFPPSLLPFLPPPLSLPASLPLFIQKFSICMSSTVWWIKRTQSSS